MPHFFPPLDLSEIQNEGESVVFQHLAEQLPEDVHVYHNFETLTQVYRNGGGAKVNLQEGETDAIIVFPDCSIVVLEVKGRGLRYKSDNGQWERNVDGNWEYENSPFKQARKNTHNLIECINKKLGEQIENRIRHGYMVVFPFSEIRGDLINEAHPTIICNATELHQLGRQLKSVPGRMASGAGTSSEKANKPYLMKEIHKAILPEMNLVHSLRAAVDSDVKLLLRLTGEQSTILDSLSFRKRALIQGVAGSGKTVLAVEKARRSAAKGERVLLLCYNNALANWIDSGINAELLESPVSGSIEVKSFHEFCKAACKNENIAFDVGDDQADFYLNTAPELLMQCSKIHKHFDAIIVDEGQDFQGIWWMPIQECLKSDGTLFVFCDPEQDIFGRKGLIDLGLEEHTYPLLRNCRNTKKIARYCDDIVGINTESHPNAPEGTSVQFETIQADEKRKDRVRDLLLKWVMDDGISPSRIAVLSPNRPAKTCLKDGISPSQVSLAGDIDTWRKGETVLHTTVRGFKGLDADFVILADLPTPDSHPVFGKTDYYVGASRAIAVLHVIAKEPWDNMENKAA